MQTRQIKCNKTYSTNIYCPNCRGYNQTSSADFANQVRSGKPAPRAESYEAAIKEIAEKNALLETINQQQHELIQKNLQFQRELINNQNTTQ